MKLSPVIVEITQPNKIIIAPLSIATASLVPTCDQYRICRALSQVREKRNRVLPLAL